MKKVNLRGKGVAWLTARPVKDFYRGAATVFDPFGLLNRHKTDRQVLADDCKVVLGDLSIAWAKLKSEMPNKHGDAR